MDGWVDLPRISYQPEQLLVGGLVVNTPPAPHTQMITSLTLSSNLSPRAGGGAMPKVFLQTTKTQIISRGTKRPFKKIGSLSEFPWVLFLITLLTPSRRPIWSGFLENVNRFLFAWDRRGSTGVQKLIGKGQWSLLPWEQQLKAHVLSNLSKHNRLIERVPSSSNWISKMIVLRIL